MTVVHYFVSDHAMRVRLDRRFCEVVAAIAVAAAFLGEVVWV
jgi:hypothetical protein